MICVLLFLGDRGDLCQLFMQQPVVLEAMQRVFACLLVTLLLGVTFSAGTFKAIDDDLRVEERRTVFGLCLIQQDIFKRDFMLLAPLQQFALEVHLLIGKFVDVYEALQNFLSDEGLAMLIPSVEIDSADERFEGIASKIAVVRLVVFVATNQLIETYLFRQFSQRCTLNNLTSCVRQETFALAGEMMEDDFAHNSTEDSISEELQAFVVDW